MTGAAIDLPAQNKGIGFRNIGAALGARQHARGSGLLWPGKRTAFNISLYQTDGEPQRQQNKEDA